MEPLVIGGPTAHGMFCSSLSFAGVFASSMFLLIDAPKQREAEPAIQCGSMWFFWSWEYPVQQPSSSQWLLAATRKICVIRRKAEAYSLPSGSLIMCSIHINGKWTLWHCSFADELPTTLHQHVLFRQCRALPAGIQGLCSWMLRRCLWLWPKPLLVDDCRGL